MQDSDPYSKVTLAILAGGEGSRMGVPKGALRIGGEPILQYLLGRFAWPGPTLLVTAPGREHPPGWESFTREAADPVGGLGPLRGVLTALENAGTEHVLVTPVDMPGLAAGQLRWLLSAFYTERSHRRDLCGLMTCRAGSTGGSGRRIEPFPAVFHRDAALPIRARLEAGRGSVHALAEDPSFLVVPAPDDWSDGIWVNLNRPAELQAFLKTRLAAPLAGR
jgi:molybdopterin-guanine dinucleotide biosynthesis protein A